MSIYHYLSTPNNYINQPFKVGPVDYVFILYRTPEPCKPYLILFCYRRKVDAPEILLFIVSRHRIEHACATP